MTRRWAAAVLMWSGLAWAVQGSATLEGTELLRVQRCDKAKEAVALTIAVGSGGGWEATTADGPFGGAWVASDTAGRRIVLDFDDASETAFLALQAGTAGVLCGSTVAIEQVTTDQFVLRLNRKRTRAKLLLKVKATGSTSAGSGTARYKLATKGEWSDGPYLDCAGLLACIGSCLDNPCVQQCFADTTPAGNAAYDALSSCVLTLCNPDDFACIDAAVAGPCAAEAAACD